MNEKLGVLPISCQGFHMGLFFWFWLDLLALVVVVATAVVVSCWLLIEPQNSQQNDLAVE